MKQQTKSIQLTIKDNIAIVTLNRANKKNAIDMSMFYELDRIQKKLKKNRNCRAVIINAAGDDFSTGIDVKQVMSHKSSIIKLLWKWLPGNANLAQRVSYNWQKIPVPVICVIKGRCWGAGLQIALGADFRLATPESQFSIMESNWGLMPDMAGNFAMHANMRLDQSLFLSMNANIIDASLALKNGLITKLSSSPLDDAYQMAFELSKKSPDALAGIKKLYYGLWNIKQRQLLARETFYQWCIILSKNQNKVIKANKTNKSASFANRLRW